MFVRRVNFTSAARALSTLRRGQNKNNKLKKNKDTSTFCFAVEARSTPAPTSKLTKEMEFVVDSVASIHILSKRDFSSNEMDTLRYQGLSQKASQVHVHDLIS